MNNSADAAATGGTGPLPESGADGDRPSPTLPDGSHTWVMGILNLTPDSFSDGGRFEAPALALRQASRLLRAGAHVLDLGAQSTRPGAVEIGAAAELERLLPSLRLIRAAHPGALLSVDTFHAEVAAAALEAGADWINDVSGGRRDPAILEVVARAGCPYVLMHSRGDSHSMDALTDYEDVVDDVCAALRRSSQEAKARGVSPRQLIWDPGLGFAKTHTQNLQLLRGLQRLKQEGFPLLIGPSRKRFIGEVLAEPRPRARLWGTAAVCTEAIRAGVDVLRVHDVAPIVQTARMMDSIVRPAG